MLSVSLIQRCFDGGHFDRLVKGIAANGLPMPLPLQARLSHPAPATALGLRRLVELTYGPTSLSGQMTRLLLALQRPGGAYAGSDENDPAATACAAAALGLVLREHGGDERVESAYERAMLALSGMQNDQGLLAGPSDRSMQDAALTSAFALHLLSEQARFREVVRIGELEAWFESHSERLEKPTEALYRLATIRGGASNATMSGALAGIAA